MTLHVPAKPGAEAQDAFQPTAPENITTTQLSVLCTLTCAPTHLFLKNCSLPAAGGVAGSVVIYRRKRLCDLVPPCLQCPQPLLPSSLLALQFGGSQTSYRF